MVFIVPASVRVCFIYSSTFPPPNIHINILYTDGVLLMPYDIDIVNQFLSNNIFFKSSPIFDKYSLK